MGIRKLQLLVMLTGIGGSRSSSSAGGNRGGGGRGPRCSGQNTAGGVSGRAQPGTPSTAWLVLSLRSHLAQNTVSSPNLAIIGAEIFQLLE